MSFQDAEAHATKAVSHIQGGNAAKAMHHIGHAMFHLRAMTSSPSGGSKIPSMSNKGGANPMNGPSKASGADMGAGGGPQAVTDALNPETTHWNNPASAAASGQQSTINTAGLRSRLAGLGK